MNPIIQWHNVNKKSLFEEIIPLNQPAILKGLVNDWPLVIHAKDSNESTLQYLKQHASNQRVYTIFAQPNERGRFFYNQNLDGVNFNTLQALFFDVLEQLTLVSQQAEPPAIAVQAASFEAVFKHLVHQHQLPVLDKHIKATFWLNNQAIVAPHYDISNNIACVVSGRRRFTLFPPEQIANLYPGPALHAFFNYYVFKSTGNPAEHLPENVQDILTNMNEQQRQSIIEFLKQSLN